MENRVFICFFLCTNLSIDDAGVSKDIVLREILKEGAGFETG